MQCSRKRVAKRSGTVQVPKKIARIDGELNDFAGHSSKKPAENLQKLERRSTPQRLSQSAQDDPEVVKCLNEIIVLGKKHLEMGYACYEEQKKIHDTLQQLLQKNWTQFMWILLKTKKNNNLLKLLQNLFFSKCRTKNKKYVELI